MTKKRWVHIEQIPLPFTPLSYPMSTDDTWTTVAHKKKQRDTRHYIKEREADALEKKLDIIGLSRALTSPESRRLQDVGWKFERVLRGNVPLEKNADMSYDFMKCVPIEENPYGDALLFMKPVE